MTVELTDFELKVARIALTEYALSLGEEGGAGPAPHYSGLTEATKLVMEIASELNERLEWALSNANEPQAARNTLRGPRN